MSELILVAVIGACLGSFVNVAALRSLDGRDWVRAPSTCCHCGQKLSFFQNLPLYGYLRHAGKSACCAQKLPPRYIYVELAMAALLLLAWLSLPMPVFFSSLPFLILSAVIFLTDFEAFIIPDWTSLGGVAVGALLVLLGAPGLPDIQTAALGGAAGYGLIMAINLTYKALRGRDGMGGGDVKLMAMLGVWLGPVSLLPILFSASMAGAVIGIAAILLHRISNEAEQPAQLPFGCFLVPMALLWLFFAPAALQVPQ